MSRSLSRSQRWASFVVALLLLLSGDGLHALTHCGGGTLVSQAASGQLELHGGDCQHRPHVPAHESHPCQVCHVGGAGHALLMPESVGCTNAARTGLVVKTATWFAGAAGDSGVLGARGPPLMSA